MSELMIKSRFRVAEECGWLIVFAVFASLTFASLPFTVSISNIAEDLPKCQTLNEKYLITNCVKTNFTTLFILTEEMKLVAVEINFVKDFEKKYVEGNKCYIDLREYDLYFFQNRTKNIEIEWTPPNEKFIITCNDFNANVGILERFSFGMSLMFGSIAIIICFMFVLILACRKEMKKVEDGI